MALASPRETGYHHLSTCQTSTETSRVRSYHVCRKQEGIPISATSRLISTDHGRGSAEQYRGTRLQRFQRKYTPMAVSVRHSHRFLALPSLIYLASTLVFMSYQSTRPQRQEMLLCSPSPIPGLALTGYYLLVPCSLLPRLAPI